jgi:hypothetical protein
MEQLLLDPNALQSPYDEGVEAYWAGKKPDLAMMFYQIGTTSCTEFAQGWADAFEYDS